jgi:hypothetical protein
MEGRKMQNWTQERAGNDALDAGRTVGATQVAPAILDVS